MNPKDIESGDTVLVSYESAYGGMTSFVGEVTETAIKSGAWAGVDREHVTVEMVTDDADRQDRYDNGYANRKVTWYDQDDVVVRAKNGGRWQRVSDAARPRVTARPHGDGGFWDCLEQETRKEAVAVWPDSPEALDVVKGYTCPCGRSHVVEVWNRGTEVEDPRFIGLKDGVDVEEHVRKNYGGS